MECAHWAGRRNFVDGVWPLKSHRLCGLPARLAAIQAVDCVVSIPYAHGGALRLSPLGCRCACRALCLGHTWNTAWMPLSRSLLCNKRATCSCASATSQTTSQRVRVMMALTISAAACGPVVGTLYGSLRLLLDEPYVARLSRLTEAQVVGKRGKEVVGRAVLVASGSLLFASKMHDPEASPYGIWRM